MIIQNNPYIIKYLPLFEDDLNKIVDYILFKFHNKNASLRLIHNIESAIIKKSYNPTSFEIFNSSKCRKNNYYRIYVNHFTIYYIVEKNVMEIRRILYNNRSLDKFI